jgi:thioredoxin reductase
VGDPVVHDVVVVGGGPAGLTAAGWLGRYRRRVLVVDSGEYRNRWTEQVHGLYANDPADPEELRGRAQRDLAQYGHVELVTGQVTNARAREQGWFELTIDDTVVRARRVVLATGVRDVFPDVGRFFEFYGRDVFHCPTCDGYLARGRRVAVFGWQGHVAGFSMELLDWADEIRIVTNGRPLEVGDDELATLSDHGIGVIEDEGVELLGARGALQGVRLAGGAVTSCSMAFFSLEHRPSNELAVQLGCALDDDGYVQVNRAARTSVEGVYAAGDLTGGIQLVGAAVGEGTAAGLACAKSLYGAPPLSDTPPPAPHPEDAVPGEQP